MGSEKRERKKIVKVDEEEQIINRELYKNKKSQTKEEKLISSHNSLKKFNQNIYVCECGTIGKYSGKYRHLKTQKHQRYVEKLDNN